MFRTYALLNVVAHPHPEGIYRKVFEKAAEADGIKFRGDRFATISRITPTENGVFRGRLATWTEIDQTAPSVNKMSLEEMSLQEAGVELPENIGFNSSIFYFAFREKEHALYVELANDEGRTISPTMVHRAFSKILQRASEGMVDELSVYVGARADAVDFVLGLSAIRKVEIDLNLPNPDDLSDLHQQALDKLNEMKARRIKATLTKAPGEDTLVLLPEWRALAELAQNNGYVATSGINEDGSREERSTKELPAEVVEEIGDGDSSFVAVQRVALDGRELGVIVEDGG